LLASQKEGPDGRGIEGIQTVVNRRLMALVG
jgi:hypothetical protein